MYCEKYSCTMSGKACIKKQHKARRKNRPGQAPADPGCKLCIQGLKIMKEHLEKGAKDDYPGLDNAETSIDTQKESTEPPRKGLARTYNPIEDTLDDKNPPNKDSTSEEQAITHTCRVPDCGHVGPLDDFAKNKKCKDGRTNECKKCHSKRAMADKKKLRGKIETDSLGKITHTCNTPGCGHVGPLDDFAKNKESKDGHTNECRKCHSKAGTENRKKSLERFEAELREKIEIELREKILKEHSAGDKEAWHEGKKPWDLKPEDKVLAINFNERTEIFDALIKAATEEIRTPEAQILYILKQGLRAKG